MKQIVIEDCNGCPYSFWIDSKEAHVCSYWKQFNIDEAIENNIIDKHCPLDNFGTALPGECYDQTTQS